MHIKYIFLGSCYLAEDEHLIKSYSAAGHLSLSNPVYEKKIYDFALSRNLDFAFISAPPGGIWPFQGKKRRVQGFTSNESLLSCSYSLCFLTLHRSKYHAIKNRLKPILRSLDSNTKLHIVAFEAHSPYLKAIKFCKKSLGQRCFSTLVVPDLPNFMRRFQKNPVYAALKRIDARKIDIIRKKHVDSYICFTEAIYQKLKDFQKPYFVSNGIIRLSQKTKETKRENVNDGIIRCIYIGKTDKGNGLKLIIDAAKINTDQRIEYHVYGSGDMDSALAEESKKINCLFFHGYISPNEVPGVLSKASVFLAPRLPDVSDYVAYSFPSKMLEYLPYGKPIITFRLPCFDEKYDSVFTYVAETTGKSLHESVVKAMNSRQTAPDPNFLSLFSPEHWFKSLDALRIPTNDFQDGNSEDTQSEAEA